ncbi:TonB-dependent receptor [Xanthomonas hortorum]|uniref:Ferrichrome receptor FcuA n=1 Tax=Xanthomonas hortorum pv. carotae TaxID=487904 RepID=A0A6V7CX41_9XANT|nr:TonB-dependent receptor [Xanthomonas hortorum]CAD0322811.1 Ferrichrome receptor FcuA [Xanthomonas hortorum pv. carotae]CAD0322819.1 Ferrichrome receptor FcuA [Xanthomonas hortorum pv. carotae]
MRAYVPHFLSLRPRARLAVAIACCYAAPIAWSQQAATPLDTAKTLDTLTVTADGSQVELPPDYAGGQVATGGRVGLFGNLDVMDTPFNSMNFTAELMRNQQARSVADVVQNDPAVRVARGFGNFQELYVVRGFPVFSDDMSYNGLYGLLPRQYVAVEFLERVEVFRGANSFINGAAPGGSGIGGAFNLVPKRAGENDVTRLTLGTETGGQVYAAADASYRFGPDRAWGLRANLARRDGENATNEDRELGMGSLGVDYRGERLRLSADIGWQDQRTDRPRPSITPVGGIPIAPDADINFAQPWTFAQERDTFGVIRAEYDLTDSVMAWAAIGMRDSDEHNVLANPNADAAGNLNTGRFDNYREDKVTTGDVGIRATFDTGRVGHRLSASASAFKLDSKNAFAFGSYGTAVGTLYDPVAVAPLGGLFPGGVLFEPLTTSKNETRSVAIADTLAFADGRILLTLGARHQTLEQYGYDYNTGARLSSYSDSVVTPVGAVVFKFGRAVSLYANYAEALLAGQEVPALSGSTPLENAGELLAPFKSRQFEIGAKYDAGSYGATAALFRINQPNTVVSNARLTSDGEQRNQGLELSFYGQPIDGLRALGGITLLDAGYNKTQDGVNEGNDVLGVPEKQANLGLEWDIAALPGLTVDGRAVYTDRQYADAVNVLEIPSWTRVDLGARYAFQAAGKAWSVRARVDNLFDRSFWSSVGGASGANYLVLAAPRTFTVSFSIDL